MDRRVDTGWPTRVAAKELPLEADPIVRFLNSGITRQYYQRAVAEPVAEHMSAEKSGLCRMASWRRRPPPMCSINTLISLHYFYHKAGSALASALATLSALGEKITQFLGVSRWRLAHASTTARSSPIWRAGADQRSMGIEFGDQVAPTSFSIKFFRLQKKLGQATVAIPLTPDMRLRRNIRRFGPLSAARTCSKRSQPFRRGTREVGHRPAEWGMI
jgi:hypothetical protein